MRKILSRITRAGLGTKMIIMTMFILFVYMAVNTAKEVYSTYNHGMQNIAVFETNMINREKQRLYNLTEMLTGYIQSYPAMKGNRNLLLSRIKSHIKEMRFDKDKSGYFFVIDNTRPYPLNLVHVNPKIEGKIMDQPLFNNRVTDNLGGKERNLMKAFFEVCDQSKEKEGFVRYLWPKPGEEKDQPKLSFVRYIPEYDFYIGTGFYIDDIYKSIDSMKTAMNEKITNAILYNLLLGFLIFLISGVIIYFGTKKILNHPLDNLLYGLKKVQDGDKDISINIIYDDELGYVSRSFNDMVATIRDSEKKLQEYAESLEGKVQERTADLSKSLENIQKLKTQQDGDYFLTSLILKPLGPNRAVSDFIKTSFVVDQKKKFVFRKWERDIGGDICITDNVILDGKKYVVFVNGDAMGKSLQGAGGALVLGAAFQSVLERSRLAADVKKQSPERWLKNAFSEMHAIFESFDGSMLMSGVIGLVEEDSGLMYYINAEHPWMVLFRDGKAEFLESDSLFRKLGSAILAGGIFVKTFQMKNHDVVFCGSDGRDDLLIGTSATGERIINEDETLFLRSVEKGKGDLDAVVREIHGTGEITDDLSLLRIEYNRAEKASLPESLIRDYLEKVKTAKKSNKITEAISILEEACKGDKKHPRLMKELFKSYITAKNYDKAVRCGISYCSDNPADTASLFALSYAMRMNKSYAKAIDVGERVRLREPAMTNNLINLSECYFAVGEYSRSEKIAKDVLKNDPGNQRMRNILDRVQNKVDVG